MARGRTCEFETSTSDKCMMSMKDDGVGSDDEEPPENEADAEAAEADYGGSDDAEPPENDNEADAGEGDEELFEELFSPEREQRNRSDSEDLGSEAPLLPLSHRGYCRHGQEPDTLPEDEPMDSFYGDDGAHDGGDGNTGGRKSSSSSSSDSS